MYLCSVEIVASGLKEVMKTLIKLLYSGLLIQCCTLLSAAAVEKLHCAPQTPLLLMLRKVTGMLIMNVMEKCLAKNKLLLLYVLIKITQCACFISLRFLSIVWNTRCWIINIKLSCYLAYCRSLHPRVSTGDVTRVLQCSQQRLDHNFLFSLEFRVLVLVWFEDWSFVSFLGLWCIL